MMKKVLSLLLALAMVMSMFTVGALADDARLGSKENPHTDWSVSIEKNFTGDTILKNDTVTLTSSKTAATNTADSCGTCGGSGTGATYNYKKNALQYEWTVKDSSGTDVTSTVKVGRADKSTFKMKCNTPDTTTGYTVTLTVWSKGSLNSGVTAGTDAAPYTECWYKATAETTIKVADETASSYKMKLTSSDGKPETLNLMPNISTVSVSVDAKLYPASGDSANTEVSGATYDWELTGNGTESSPVIDFSNSSITAVHKTGTVTIYRTATYQGHTWKIKVATVNVDTYEVSDSVSNGSTYEKKITDLVSLIGGNIADVLKKQENLSTKPTVKISSITLSIPSNSFAKDAYYGTSKKDDTKKTAESNKWTVEETAGAGKDAISGNNKLYLTTTAGTIGSMEISYTVSGTYKSGNTTNNITDITGTLTLKSDYIDKAVTQTADFAREDFYLNSISGISVLREYTSDDATSSSYDEDKVHSASYFKLDNEDGKTYFIGYASKTAGKEVAYKVEVTVKAKDYDFLVYAQDGDTPFDDASFSSFVKAVYKENGGTASNVRLDEVSFDTVSESNKWKLKKGSSTISTTDWFDADDVEKIKLDLDKPGVYTINFTASTEVKSGSSWSDGDTYQGTLCLYATAGGSGDIQYDTSYGKSVTFSVSDFEKYYKKEATGSSPKLEYVVFDTDPEYGKLYPKSGASSTVDDDDVFYVSPSGSQDALSKVTYKAHATKTAEYSDYITFTAHGDKGDVIGTVEIVVNGSLPFTDVAAGSTFYDNIKYCYDNDLMGGKTATKFDAKSSISRIQLVVVLYRMAGSPTDYDNKTLPFTDCKGMSSEFTSALKWAVNKGIVNGISSTKFAPNNAVTRQAMVTILYRYANKYGYDTGVYGTSLSGYTDASKVSSSMKNAMIWAVENGFVSGNGKKLNPTGSTTRGAASKILGNFHQMYIA